MAAAGNWDGLQGMYENVELTEKGAPVIGKTIKDSLIAITCEYKLEAGLEYFDNLLYQDPSNRQNAVILNQYNRFWIDFPTQDLIAYYSYIQTRDRPPGSLVYIPKMLKNVKDSLMVAIFKDFVDVLADPDTTIASFKARLGVFTLNWKKEYYPDYKDCLKIIPRLIKDNRALTFEHLKPLSNQMILDGDYSHPLTWSRTMKGVPPQYDEIKELLSHGKALQEEAESLEKQLAEDREGLNKANDEREDCLFLTGTIIAELSHTEGIASEYEINTSRGRAILYTNQTRYSRQGSFGLDVTQLDHKQEVKISGGFTQQWPVFTESPKCKDGYLTDLRSQISATKALLKKNKATSAQLGKKIRAALEEKDIEKG